MKYTFSEKELTTPAAPPPPRLPHRAGPSGPRPGGGGWKWFLAVLAVAVAAGCVVWRCRVRTDRDALTRTCGAVPEKETAPKNVTLTKDTARRIAEYLTPSDAEMEQLYRMVVNTPFVAENLQYRDKLKDIPFLYVATNDTVNALAGVHVTEKGNEKEIGFHTVFFGGAARYARLVGLAAALEEAGNKDIFKTFVEAMPKRFCARCPEEDCVAFIAANGLAKAATDEKIRMRAVSFSSGTIVSILAHECGHHAFGHLLNTSKKKNLEINRNQEREADSFASSVISASPFGEYVFAGTLFWHYALAVQADGDSDLASTHPLSKERFKNFLQANAEKTAALGIKLE